MVLRFNNHWRFSPPDDGTYVNKAAPREVVEELYGLALKVATQGSRQGVIEHFKSRTAAAAGQPDGRSSNEQWAASGRRVMMLHSLVKKSQKTPLRELDIARKRMREVKHENS